MKITCLNVRKINKCIDNLSKELEEQMKGIQISNSNYNGMDFTGISLYLHLSSYMNENIFPAMGYAKYANSSAEKCFFVTIYVFYYTHLLNCMLNA